MTTLRIRACLAVGLSLTFALACRLWGRGPTDEDVIAAVRKAPPSPPTLGPTYLAEVQSIQIQERGQHKTDGRYWPIRIQVKGPVKTKLTNPFQVGHLVDPRDQAPAPVEFVEEGRFAQDDFGKWRVEYRYEPTGPRWRLDDPQQP